MAEDNTSLARTATGNLNIQDAAIKTKLKQAVERALRAEGATRDTVATAIMDVINGEESVKPKTDEERTQLAQRAREISERLIAVKTEKNADEAVKAFNEGLDKADGKFPMGIALGGAAGVAAAVATDIGDWKSFGGIMKKLALVAAGVGVGIAVNNDYGLRDKAVGTVTGMFSGNSNNNTPTR